MQRDETIHSGSAPSASKKEVGSDSFSKQNSICMAESTQSNSQSASQVTTRPQRTLGGAISFSGIGVHTGQEVTIRFNPAAEGTGVVFRRMDLPNHPLVPATVEFAKGEPRHSTIAAGEAKVYTPEHVLAALMAYGIDNVVIDLNASEPPVGNGSSDAFVEMIEKVGVVNQSAEVKILNLSAPVSWSQGDVHIVAIPCDRFKVSYTLHYPKSKALGSQYFSIDVTSETFKAEIARCRTFCLYEEISALIDFGLIKGGSLDNAVVIKDDVVLSREGLRYPDEPVRHKVLDLIGDLSLVGLRFNAHVISIRSGHTTNVAFAKKLYDHLTGECS
jgi:UDP-3-O-[3-hydroxymyristoyl] N-acetylglucosamine deacetylase